VSVTQTLKNLIKNKNYVEALLFDKRKPGIYTNFCDGDSVGEHLCKVPSSFRLVYRFCGSLADDHIIELHFADDRCHGIT